MTTENTNGTMEELLMSNYDFKKIHRGEIVKGKVIKVTDKEVFVNINYISDGIIPRDEFAYDEEVSLKDIIKVEDEVYVMVIKTDDGDGNVLLSKKEADAIKVWEELEDYKNNDVVITVKIKEAVKAGLVAMIKGIRAFIPASQISLNTKEDLVSYVGKELQVKIIEVNEDNKKVILSGKQIEIEHRHNKREELWNILKVGEKRKGIITRLVNFGAFVDLGGLEGLIHLKDLSWKRIRNASEVVSSGDKVEVYITGLDKDRNRISLALKEVEQDPWLLAMDRFKVNETVEGTVVNFINAGAFVEIIDGVEGFVHISEISEERVIKPSDVLSIDDKVKVRILDIDKKNKKISLSIKEGVEKIEEDFSEFNNNEEGYNLGELFKDKLKNFKFE